MFSNLKGFFPRGKETPPNNQAATVPPAVVVPPTKEVKQALGAPKCEMGQIPAILAAIVEAGEANPEKLSGTIQFVKAAQGNTTATSATSMAKTLVDPTQPVAGEEPGPLSPALARINRCAADPHFENTVGYLIGTAVARTCETLGQGVLWERILPRSLKASSRQPVRKGGTASATPWRDVSEEFRATLMQVRQDMTEAAVARGQSTVGFSPETVKLKICYRNGGSTDESYITEYTEDSPHRLCVFDCGLQGLYVMPYACRSDLFEGGTQGIIRLFFETHGKRIRPDELISAVAAQFHRETNIMVVTCRGKLYFKSEV